MARSKTDPFKLVARGNNGSKPPDYYLAALRELGAFEGLSAVDAQRVAETIGVTLSVYGRFGNSAVDDPRLAEQLYNSSVNAPARADGMGWDDPEAVGRSFTIAKLALEAEPC